MTDLSKENQQDKPKSRPKKNIDISAKNLRENLLRRKKVRIKEDVSEKV